MAASFPDIVVPASISNLGPGFDALSVAVTLYMRIQVQAVRPEAPDTIESTFQHGAPAGDNRVETAFKLARQRCGTPTPGLRIRIVSDIPMRSGLGSSAAASIAGLRLYEAAAGLALGTDWLRLATELEGHPDNAAAALSGGMTVSCQREDGRILSRAWPWPPSLHFIVATPEAELSTAVARRALPQAVPLGDAVYNLQRAVLLVRALETGQYEDLREAMHDRWHQPARAPLVPGLAEALALNHPALLGVCLSGAGPSVVALVTDDHADVAAALGQVYARMGMPYTIRTLRAHRPLP